MFTASFFSFFLATSFARLLSTRSQPYIALATCRRARSSWRPKHRCSLPNSTEMCLRLWTALDSRSAFRVRPLQSNVLTFRLFVGVRGSRNLRLLAPSRTNSFLSIQNSSPRAWIGISTFVRLVFSLFSRAARHHSLSVIARKHTPRAHK